MGSGVGSLGKRLGPAPASTGAARSAHGGLGCGGGLRGGGQVVDLELPSVGAEGAANLLLIFSYLASQGSMAAAGSKSVDGISG